MMRDKIGRYEIRGTIGRGGMGTVYLGYDPRFEREVAIKVLPPHLIENAALRARFEREARTVAALEHPAIVAVYDFDEVEQQPYLVMQYMTGGTLSNRLEQGPLSTEEAAKILSRIGSALDEAHRRGIVHRDLKPGNILFDRYGNAYLSDFGIVSLASQAGDLTGAGTVGTPGYMSPEQIQGQMIDGRTDIYALGVLVFEMLTGRKPFDGATPAMIMVRQMTEPPPDLRQLRPDLPVAVKEIIEQALARDKHQRPNTAGEVVAMLSLAAQASTVAAAQLSATAEALQPSGSSVAAGQPPETPSLETLLVTPDASPAPLPAPAAPSLPGAAAPPVVPESPRRAFPWLLAALGVLVLLAAGTVVLLVLLNLGDLGSLFGSTVNTPDSAGVDAAEGALEPEDEGGDAISAESPAAPLIEQAWELISSGEYAAARSLADEALALDPDYLEAYLIRVIAARELGEFQAAFVDLETLIAREPDKPDWYIEQAWTYDWVGDPAGAVASMQRCLEVAPASDYCWLLKGTFHSHLGEDDLARDAWLRAVELNPNNVEALFELTGHAFWVEHNPDLAREYAEAAVNAADDDPYVYLTRGHLLADMGDLEAAAADFRHFVELVPPDECPECIAEIEAFMAEHAGTAAGLGLSPAGQALFLNPAVAPLHDIRVRRALAHALDRQVFAETAAEAEVYMDPRPATTWLHPDLLGADLLGMVGLPFNPDLARQLMAEAGFPDGRDFPALTLVVDPPNEPFARIAISMWRETLGLEVGLEVMEGEYVRNVFQEPPALFRLGYRLSPDQNSAESLLRHWFGTGGDSNVLGYSNPAVDELLDAESRESDPEVRKELLTEIERLLTMEDTIIVPLFHHYSPP